MDELTEQSRRAIEVVEEALRPDGWTVSTVVHQSGVKIVVDHPVSVEHGLNFRNDDRDHLAFVAEVLDSREFSVIARRPTRLDHPALLKSLRAAAVAHEWDPSTLDSLARILESHDLLTEEEGRWFATAGLAWD